MLGSSLCLCGVHGADTVAAIIELRFRSTLGHLLDLLGSSGRLPTALGPSSDWELFQGRMGDERAPWLRRLSQPPAGIVVVVTSKLEQPNNPLLPPVHCPLCPPQTCLLSRAYPSALPATSPLFLPPFNVQCLMPPAMQHRLSDFGKGKQPKLPIILPLSRFQAEFPHRQPVQAPTTSLGPAVHL